MPKEARESVSQVKRKRRPLLTGAVIVLGASSILQPAGAVFGNAAQDAPKKEEPAAHQVAKRPAGTHKTPVATPNTKNKGVKSHTAKRGTAKRSSTRRFSSTTLG